MGRRHRHGRSHSLLRPRPRSSLSLIKDVALGAFIAREIIKKWAYFDMNLYLCCIFFTIFFNIYA